MHEAGIIPAEIAAEGQIENWANQIAALITTEAQKGLMLPKTAAQIANKYKSGEAAIVFDQDDKPIGYCEYDAWGDSHVEIGGLIVDPVHRKHHVGTKVALQAIFMAQLTYPEATVFALTTNDKSAGLFAQFTQIGAKPLVKEELPGEVWSWCAPSADNEGCKQFKHVPGPEGCCASSWNLTHIDIEKVDQLNWF